MSHLATFQSQDPRSPTSFRMNDPSSRQSFGSVDSPGRDNPPRPLEMDPLKSRGLALSTPSLLAGDSAVDGSPYPNKLPRQWGIEQFYRSDGPWVPSGIVATRSEDHRGRNRSSVAGNRGGLQPAFPGPWRDSGALPSECDTYDQRGPLLSDSGYGTRNSESTSCYGDPDRNHETQSIAGRLEYFNLAVPPESYGRDTSLHRDWAHPPQVPTPSEQSVADGSHLMCATCRKVVKTKSELNKHDQRHRKPNVCDVVGCQRASKGFGTTNDLDRHKRSVHPELYGTPGSRYVCHLEQCQAKNKIWPRADNFRSHLKRVHSLIVTADEDLFRFVYKKFPTVLEGVGSSVAYFPPFGTTVGDSLSPSWHLEQRSPDLGLSQTRSPHIGMDRSVTSMSFPDTFSESFAQVRAQARDDGQDVTRQEGSPPSPSMDLDETPASPISLENAKPAEISSERDGQYVQPDAVLKDPSLIVSETPQIKSLRGKEDKEHVLETTKCTAVRQAPIVAPSTVAQADLSDGATTSAVEEGVDGDIGSESCESPKSGTIGSSPMDDPAASDSEDDEADDAKLERIASPPPSLLDGPMDSDAEEKVIQFLKKLKKEGMLEKLCRKANHSAAKKVAPTPVAVSDSHPCTDPRCNKTFARKCELKKHAKRHEKPYGCTFPACSKKFGSKNDWKRHENSQHFQLEVWKCDETTKENPDEICGRVCHRRETFKHHLKEQHDVADAKKLDDKIERCRIGRNCETRFWCGLCQKIVEIKQKGLSAWSERFNHIDDHIAGRNNALKKEIKEWKSVDPKHPDADLTTGTEDSDAASPGECRATAQSPGKSASSEDSEKARPKKRKADDANDRSGKRAKHASIMWFCCHCDNFDNLQTTTTCASSSCAHQFCGDCRQEAAVPRNADQ